MAMTFDEGTSPKMLRDNIDVKIVWKGGRIAKLVFPSGKTVEFHEALGLSKLKVTEEPSFKRSKRPNSSPRGV